MKTKKIIYWVTTVLFSGFMIMSAIPNVLSTKESVDFITALGYPAYFIPLIGVAKVLGGICILIPMFKKLKEWAYAGLTFDLLGAVYSLIYVHGFDPSMSIMFIIIAVGATSYVLNSQVNN